MPDYSGGTQPSGWIRGQDLQPECSGLKNLGGAAKVVTVLASNGNCSPAVFLGSGQDLRRGGSHAVEGARERLMEEGMSRFQALLYFFGL